jgi:hypothetical protein
VGEHLLERHEAIALAEREKPRQAFGHFHAGEALLPVLRVAHEDRETDREAGDVRERLTGSNRERGEHRVDVALVAPLELDCSDSERSSTRAMAMPSLASAGHSSPDHTCA